MRLRWNVGEGEFSVDGGYRGGEEGSLWKKRRLTRRTKRERERRKRKTRKGDAGGEEEEEGGGGGGQKERERKREAVGIFARERARVGKRGENKLKAKLYSHKKMELFLDAVPPRYEEKEG